MAFVYRHIRLDKNEPFYIGIGSKNNFNRAYNTKRNKIWNEIASNTEFDVEIIFDDLSWEEAKEKEKEFISLYGRINTNTGVLANLTNGGAGMLGFKFDENARKNMSIAQRNKKPISEETRKRLSTAVKNRDTGAYWRGKKVPQDIIENRRKGLIGIKKSKKECPHCGLIGGAPQMAQWHFNNCKNIK
jgi:hypothetical protein